MEIVEVDTTSAIVKQSQVGYKSVILEYSLFVSLIKNYKLQFSPFISLQKYDYL